MNTNHEAESKRLFDLAQDYEIKARIHSGDSQGVWFWCMSRSKELQAQWHWRRCPKLSGRGGGGGGGDFSRCFVYASIKSLGRPEPSGCGGEGGKVTQFTSDTNIAQVPERTPVPLEDIGGIHWTGLGPEK